MNMSLNFQYNSKVILSYFFISLLALILDYVTKGKSNKKLFSCYRSSIFSPLTYVRLLTHVIGHDGWDHFKSNFLMILLIGPSLEEKYGSIEILSMIVVTALITGILHNLFKKTRLLGASGISFMFILLSSFVNIQAGTIPITLVLISIFYVIDEIKDSFLKKKDHISHLGHLIGALCGVGFGFYYLHYNSLFEIINILIKK